jgi:hypothetical protein
MELHIQSHHWERRSPDWVAAAVAGLAGGALVIALEFVWSTLVLGSSPWQPTHKIAAMVMGRSALGQMTQFNLEIVAMALLLHYVLGAIMGMMLAAIMAPFRFDSSVGMEAAIGGRPARARAFTIPKFPEAQPRKADVGQSRCPY